MKRRSNLLLYLLLNILVSAATTLAVLWVWDNARGGSLPFQQALAQETAQVGAAANPQPAALKTTPAATGAQAAKPAETLLVPPQTAQPTGTMPAPDVQVIQIISVVGAGDLQQEVVLLKRAGEGNVRMVGWKMVGEHKNSYTFPEQPELILYKDGAVQVYTKAGTDTVTEVYWNRTEAAWRSGELIRLLDAQGNERATYRVP